MIGAKGARALTVQAHHEGITKTKAEEWLEGNGIEPIEFLPDSTPETLYEHYDDGNE